MPAVIGARHKRVGNEFLKKSAGAISGAVGDYISEIMPVTSSIISDTTETVKQVNAKLGMSSNERTNFMKLKATPQLKNIFTRFNRMKDDYAADNGLEGDLLSYDIDTDTDQGAQLAFRELTESQKNANQISSAVIESAQQQAETSIAVTAEIKTAIAKQTATIDAGFTRVNSTLEKILDVITKNTATLIETTAAGFGQIEQSNSDKLFQNRQFNLKTYMGAVKDNFNKSELGMLAAFMPVFTNKDAMKGLFNPQDIIKGVIGTTMNKVAPNFKKNLAALDQAVSNTIMASLVRLGEKSGPFNTFGKIFGLRADRQEYGNAQKSKLELKSVAFDTMTREAITNTIPGYLREILKALNGKDMVYDYRSRNFKTQKQINSEFKNQSVNRNTLSQATSGVRNAIGNDEYGNMVYDVLMTYLGTKTNGGEHQNIINSFSDPSQLIALMDKIYKENGAKKTNSAERRRLEEIAKSFANRKMTGIEMGNQVASNNINRNRRLEAILADAERYNTPITASTSAKSDIMRRLSEAGRLNDSNDKQIKNNIDGGQGLTGVDYTNKALYEIYKVLARGINVYRVGYDNSQSEPYENLADAKHLVPPRGHKPRAAMSHKRVNAVPRGANPDDNRTPRGANPLRNNVREDGTMEDLSGGERIFRWGKERGGDLAHSVLFGSADDVVNSFNNMMQDVVDVTGEKVRAGAERINQAFGNVTGYLNHKLFGKEYEYMDGNEKVKVAKNEKAGVFAFVGDYIKDMFSGAGDKAKKWFSSVESYFDYSEPGEKREVKDKRKRLIATSVGAMAGGGLLGGPLGALMGAIAGNALSTANIGSRIKEMLFGKGEDGKKKGLVTRLVDNVVDPIRYQFEKTFSHLGDVLKKRILGPISDIGRAIKERATAHADSAFGKVFKKIGSWITAPFRGIAKGIGKLISLPAKLIGSTVRGVSSAAGGAVGGLAEALAIAITPKGKRKEAYQRYKDRNKQIDAESDPMFKDYDTWKAAQDARRSKWGSKETKDKYFGDKETRIKIEEKQAEDTDQIKQDVSTLADKATHEGSLFTHDKGIHERLDRLIELVETQMGLRTGGNAPKNITDQKAEAARKLKESVSRDLANSALGGGVGAATEGDITESDQRNVEAIMNEASKANPSTTTVKARLKELLQSQRAKREAARIEKTKETTTTNNNNNSGGGFNIQGLLDILKKFGTAILGILGLLKILKNIITPNEPGSSAGPATEGFNDVGHIFDVDVDNVGSLPLPGTKIYHADTDAAGNKIENAAAEHVRNYAVFGRPMGQTMIQATGQALDARLKRQLPNPDIEGANASAAASQETLKTGVQSTTAGIRRNMGKVAVGAGASYGLGTVSGLVMKQLGATDEQAQAGGRFVTEASSAAFTANEVISRVKGKESWAGKILDVIKKCFNFLADRVKAIDCLRKGANKITQFFDDIITKIAGGLTDKIAQGINAAMNKLGIDATSSSLKEGASVITGGIATVGAGIVGGVSGAVSAANLFNVFEEDVDGTMRTAAALVNGLWNAAEWAPAASKVMMIVDIVDTFLIKPIFKKSIKSMLAEFFYNLIEWLGNGQKDWGVHLKEVQGKFEDARQTYMKTYNVDIDAAAFNDMINNTGLVDRIMRGKYKGTDVGGRRIEGGVKGAVFSQEIEYMRDSEGNVIKNAEGKAVEKVDKYGNVVKDNAKLGDKAAAKLNDAKRFFTGGTVYKTDAEGNAILDENGHYVVESKEKNIFGKIWDFGNRNKNKAKQNQTAVDKSTEKIVAAAEKGDASAVLSESINLDSDDPTSGFQESVFSLNQMMLSAPATMSTVGDETSLSLENMLKSSDKDRTLFENAMKQLSTDAKSGQSYTYNLSFDKNDPMAGLYSSAFSIAKMYRDAQGTLNTTANTVSSFTNVNSAYSGYSFGGPAVGSSESGVSGVNGRGTNQLYKHDEFGGNPLNKDYSITSSFGHRTFPRSEDHTGIDIVPADQSGKALVSSRFNGVISKIVSNVPDSDTAHRKDINGQWEYTGKNPGGNQVWIETDDGLTIKNMHLKHGSIPGNLKVGTPIKYDTAIGEIGSTGNSTAPHLHYQIERKDNARTVAVDPTSNLNLGKASKDKKDDGPLQKLLNIALNEVGTVEDPPESNNVKYNTWYYGHEVSGKDYAWCMAFVQWCFDQAGYPLQDAKGKSGETPMSNRTASCFQLLSWYKEHYPDTIVSAPMPGDVVIFDFSHTGIVVDRLGEDSIKTVEGNTSPDNGGDQRNGGCVAIKVRSISQDVKPQARGGFIRPVDFAGSNGSARLANIQSAEPAVGSPYKIIPAGAVVSEDRSAKQDGNSPDMLNTEYGGNPLNKEYEISSGFGKRTYPKNDDHKGVDLIPKNGSTTALVAARFPGKVVKIVNDVPDADTAQQKDDGTWEYTGMHPNGNEVWIETDNGLLVKNMHLKAGSIPKMNIGAKVKFDTAIGEMGSTGWSTAPHLHYQLEQKSKTRGYIPVDPTSNLQTGKGTLEPPSKISPPQNTTPATVTDPGPSIFDTETGNDPNAFASSGSSSLSIFDQLLEKLTIFGSTALSNLTGGVFSAVSGSSSSDATATSSGFNASNNYGFATTGGSIQATTSAKAFLEMCQAEVGTTENPPNSNNVKYNTWFYGHEVSGKDYPWCMAFVQWCFNNAGLTLPVHTASCSVLLDYYQKSHPDLVVQTPKPGDIMLFANYSHTGIVKAVNGNELETIEGNTSPGTSGSQYNGGCVADKKHIMSDAKAFVRAVDFEAMDNVSSAAISSNTSNVSIGSADTPALWNYLRSLGWSDIQIAGMLGCYQCESNINPKRVEWDNGNAFQAIGYDGVDTDRNATDDFVLNHLFPMYDKQYAEGKRDKPINKNAYKGTDGHWYPGLGFAQWTGPRAQALLAFAKQQGKKWYDPDLQLAYLDSELKGSYHKVMESTANATSPEQAAQIFCNDFEGASDSSKRQVAAKALYSQYAGKFDGSNLNSGTSLLAQRNGAITNTDPNAAAGGPDSPRGLQPTRSTRSPARIRGMGGPSTSTITSSSYVPRSNTSATSQRVASSRSFNPVPHVSPTSPSVSTTSTSSTPSINTNQVIQYLTTIVEVLRQISAAENSGNELLGSINDKDFKDTELRNTLNALGSAKKAPSQSRSTSSKSTNRAVRSMAKP